MSNPAKNHSSKTSRDSVIRLQDLFTKEELQTKQDLFSESIGVASIITFPDGTPYTQPSKFSEFCNLVRQTEKGRVNCYKSDRFLGQPNAKGPLVSPCLSAGLWDAGVSMMVQDNHLGNWLIGQVRNEELDERKIQSYANDLNVSISEFSRKLKEVPLIPLEKFKKIAEMLYSMVNDITTRAYNNYLLRKEIENRKRLEKNLQITLGQLRSTQSDLTAQNEEYVAVNEELNQANEEYQALNEELSQKNEDYNEINEQLVKSNSKLKKALGALEESNQRNKSLLEALPDMIFILDRQGNYVDYNIPDKMQPFVENSQIIGKNIRENMSADYCDKYFSSVKTLLETGKAQYFEYHLENDGKIKYYGCTIVKHNHSKVLAVVRDITQSQIDKNEIRKSQQRFTLLLDNVFDGIYMIKGEKFEYVNKQLCKILGYTSEQLTDPSFDLWNTLTDKGKQIVKQRYAARLEGKHLPSVYEFQVQTPDGKIKDIEVSTTEVSNDKVPLVLGVMRDITEAKRSNRLETEINLTRKSAEFKQKFLANMSHEIRTPLTGMIGLVDILAKTPLNENQKIYMDNLRQSGENLRHIINLILDYSKIESGEVEMRDTVIEKKELFRNSETLFNSICRKPIELKVDIDENIPDFLKTDINKLNQIISNLLSNAVKFTESGYIEIKASLVNTFKKTEDNQKRVEIRIDVSDTGMGIDPGLKKHLFKPFAQLENEETRTLEGTGLGLSICKELTLLFGGKIDVDSLPGKGSNFWFTFKCEVANDGDYIEKEQDYQNHLNITDKNLNILLVEDRKVNQMVISLMLKDLGHMVTIANNGEESIHLYKDGEFDLILMDIQMPVMDGIKATQLLKDRYKSLPPVIGLSANAFEGDKEKYIRMGMDDYLTKPVKYDDFQRLIGTYFS